MNKLCYDKTRREIVMSTLDKIPNPRVKTDVSYSFGDILNIWNGKNGCGIDRLFIRDDHYLTHTDIFIGMDLRSYTFRTIKQITSFEDGGTFTEAYIPSIEDLLEHEWYEYIPMSCDES